MTRRKRSGDQPPEFVLSSDLAAPVPIELSVSDEKLQQVADRQRAFAELIAGKLEGGDQLNEFERGFAAALVRRAADSITGARKRKRARPRKVDPGALAIEFGILRVLRGMKEADAIGELAGRHSVLEETIRIAIKPYKAAVVDWFKSGVPKKSAD
jgi:hypothetical protein